MLTSWDGDSSSFGPKGTLYFRLMMSYAPSLRGMVVRWREQVTLGLYREVSCLPQLYIYKLLGASTIERLLQKTVSRDRFGLMDAYLLVDAGLGRV